MTEVVLLPKMFCRQNIKSVLLWPEPACRVVRTRVNVEEETSLVVF